jgi:bla regulator protein BlaR1
VNVIAHLWQSTLFVAAIALVAFFLRRRAARSRHALWLLASIKFVVPFSILTAAGAALAAWMSPLVSWRLSLGGSQGAAAWLERSRPFWTLEVTPEAGTWLMAVSDASSIAGALWIAGTVSILAWRCRQWLATVDAARRARPLLEGRELTALRSAAGRAGFDGIELRQVDASREPAVVGIRRVAILWPEGLGARLTDGELEAVFAHELCHVARRDNLSSVLQIAVETLFWFHPMVWWLSGRLVHERERACDEEVVHMGTDKTNYAAGILKVCGFCLRAPAAFAAGIGSSDLAQRVERILGAPSPRAAGAVVPAIVVAMLALPLAAGVVGARQDQPAVLKPGNGVSHPKLVKEAKPKYTAAAMQEKVQGTVWLSAIILSDGTVGEVKVTRSLDKVHGLDDEAIATLKKWKFEPARKDGKPVAVQVDVEMSFKLK